MKTLIRRTLRPETALLWLFGIISWLVLRNVHEIWVESLSKDFKWVVKFVPVTFLLAGGYAWVRDLRDESNQTWLRHLPLYGFEILLSGALVYLVHQWHPPTFIDDSGFILRYLENFQEGYFYTFNPQDGPAFGISSLFYGLFTGLLSFSHLFSPENTLLFSNYLGLFLLSFFVFRILRQSGLATSPAFFVWVFAVLGSRAYVMMSNSGMETSLHLGIVSGALYFYLRQQSWPMWAMLALATFSKLDTVPLVVLVAGFYLIENRNRFFPISLKNKELQNLLFFAIVPVLCYLLFTTLVFGSPLPLSAHSKFYHHYHLEGFFPWFEYFYKSPFKRLHLFLFFPIFIAHLFLILEQKNWKGLRLTVFGWGFLVTSALYYVYNPGERMMWYYAMPDVLMLMQLGISFVSLAQRLPRKTGIAFFSLSMIVFLAWNVDKQLGENRYYLWSVPPVEQERIEVGKYVACQTSKGDTITAAHGHTSRYTEAYVIDMVGLNNATAVPFGLDQDSVQKALRPHLVVNHGYHDMIYWCSELGYYLDRSFYDIAIRVYPTWRIYKRFEEPNLEQWVRPVLPDRIEAEGEVKKISSLVAAHGNWARFYPGKNDSLAHRLDFGARRRHKPTKIELICVVNDSTRNSLQLDLEVFAEDRFPDHETKAFSIDLEALHGGQGFQFIELKADQNMHLLDPVLVSGAKSPPPVDCPSQLR